MYLNVELKNAEDHENNLAKNSLKIQKKKKKKYNVSKNKNVDVIDNL